MKTSINKTRKERRMSIRKRIRSRVSGTPERPRLAFFKSNTNVYAQLIDDTASKTIIGISSLKSKEKKGLDKAKELGKDISEAAKGKGISDVVFDRGGFKYIGMVKVFADAAREGGLKF